MFSVHNHAQSPIYKALLMPLTVMGVEYHYAVLEGSVIFFTFIFSKQIFVLLIGIPLHISGILLQRYDQNIMNILYIHAAHISPGRNKHLWGGKTYAP